MHCVHTGDLEWVLEEVGVESGIDEGVCGGDERWDKQLLIRDKARWLALTCVIEPFWTVTVNCDYAVERPIMD